MSKTTCTTWKDRMVELLYEEIEPGERARLQAHLDGCAPCAEELQQLQAVRTRLQAVRALEPDLGSPRVVFLPARPPRSAWRPARMAAAAAVVLLSLLALFNARFAWGETGPEVAFSLRPAKAAPPEGWAQQAADELRSETQVQRETLLATFREELQRREREDAQVLEAALEALLDDLERRRNHDLRYLMTEMGSLELRTGREMARTHELLQRAVLASNPGVGLDR